MDEVRVYTTPTCPWCAKVKSFLREKDISFTEVDVRDRDGARQMIELTGQRGVPVTVFGSDIIVGFDREALERRCRVQSG